MITKLELKKFSLDYIDIVTTIIRLIDNIQSNVVRLIMDARLTTYALPTSELQKTDETETDQKSLLYDMISSFHHLFNLWYDILIYYELDPTTPPLIQFLEFRTDIYKKIKNFNIE